MYKTILPGSMKKLEQAYMSEFGIPSILLMENAAQGVAEAIRRHAPSGSTVIFLCGPGANGGDGYAAAHIWQKMGGLSLICSLSPCSTGDALVYRTLALQAGASLVPFSPAHFSSASLVVDALFGTGLSRPVEGTAAEWLHAVSKSGLPVIAVDTPSGIDGNTGDVLGKAVHCVETVTFHRPKLGLYLKNAPDYTGRIVIHPILIPPDYHACAADDGQDFLCLDSSDLRHVIEPRRVTSHKGTFGRTLILAGSEGMAGAAAMCGNAAIRSGSGLTTFLCSCSLMPLLQTLCPQATCRLLPSEDLMSALAIVRAELQHATQAVIGCGLSVSSDHLPFLAVFREAACPVIWDADALNMLSLHGEWLPLPEKDFITPHPGEAARLLGLSTAQVLADPLEALSMLRQKCGCHVLLKGARSLMISSRGRALNPEGTPALAKGGSGDILAGILCALLPRISSSCIPDGPLTAMQSACLIHARAAIRAAEMYGEDCVTAQDILNEIRLS